jgi:2-polyprenyl-3-methyl-5-hydroxy-6-metoxy-1,4-benzoquinol methylase
LDKLESLYGSFASHYDFIFPENPKTLAFLKESFPNGPLLDLGAATGSYALGMAEIGLAVEGVDLDPKMIELAKEKASSTSNNPQFKVMDIAMLDEDSFYQGIYSIGNTIVHLKDKAAIKDLLERIYRALAKGGVMVLQIINYDRILRQRVTRLPDITNEGRRFIREYELYPEYVMFKTTLLYQHLRIEANTKLIALCRQELVENIKDVGFTDIELYGGYDKQDYKDNESYHLVVRAKKRA